MDQRRRPCILNCDVRGMALHKFPHPEKNPEEYAEWCNIIGIKESNSMHTYIKKRICGRHFLLKDKTPGHRLFPSARPSLNLQGVHLSLETMIETEHDYCLREAFTAAQDHQPSERQDQQEDSNSKRSMSESEDGFTNAKFDMLQLFSLLNDAELDSIEHWISSQSYKKDLAQLKDLQKTDKALVQIGNTIKKIIPFGAELASEAIVPPTIGSSADCNEVNTCHVDEFLYDEDEVDKLVEKGKIKRNYCIDCNSRNVKPLIFTSHSMSRTVLQYIFKVLLPKDLEDKQILDIGSRIGAVLYSAYYFSNASTIIGIEMNKECCEVQERIISQYSMDNNRIKVIHSDVTARSDVVANSDIIIMNMLDFFVDVEKHKKMWYFFKKHIRKGCYLVFNRSMADTLAMLDISEEFMDWLSICKPHQQENDIFFNMEDYHEIYLYTVN